MMIPPESYLLSRTADNFLATLRRIPDDVILSMATREIVPDSPYTCICGWAVRESIAHAAENGGDAEDVATHGAPYNCKETFGGTYEEWGAVFSGICYPHKVPLIEDAFVTRVMEAAGVAS